MHTEYQEKLEQFKADKSIIVEQTKGFQEGLENLTQQLNEKTEAAVELRSELDTAYQKIGEL